MSKAIEDAHDAAVADVLTFLERNAAFTRSGTNGVAQVDTTGLIATAFTHRDSLAGDPDLHTHVAISNKVATVDANGVQRWLALDGQPLHRITVAASELYNTRLEAHIAGRLAEQGLGVRFAETTPAGRGKRPVREIVGVPTELNERWSSRRKSIEARTAELSKQFQATHGREPTNVEAIALAQQATLESREAKHELRSLAEQRHTWHSEAVEVLGGQRQLTSALGQVLSATRGPVEQITPECIGEQAAKAIEVVAEARSSWPSTYALSGDLGGELAHYVAQVRGDLGVLPRVLPVERFGRHRQLQVLDHPRASDAEGLAGLVVRPHPAVLASRRADDGHRLVLQRTVAERPRQPVDRVLEHARDAAVVLRGDGEGGVGVGSGGPQRHHGGGHVFVVDVLVVERQVAEPVEQRHRNPVRRSIRRQLGQLTVDRCGTQATHQSQYFDVPHYKFPSCALVHPCTTQPDCGPIYSGCVKVQK